MLTDALLKDRGLQVLDENLGPVDMERFIVMLSRDASDYTKWHEDHDETVSVREYSERAMAFITASKPTNEKIKCRSKKKSKNKRVNSAPR